MLRTEFFTDAVRFAAVVEPLLVRDRVGATMVSHVLANHLAAPFADQPLLAAVADGDRVLAAALRVASYPLLVVVDPDSTGQVSTDPDRTDSTDPDGTDRTSPQDSDRAVLDGLAGAVIQRRDPIVGFSGRRRAVALLADAWTARTGDACRIRMSSLFYRLDALLEPTGVPGTPRLASMADRRDVDLLAEWFYRFRVETGVGRAPLAPDPDMLLRNSERGEVFQLWCVDGRPVAAAGHSAVRHGSARIAPVYTPPDQRKRGYGSAVTAAAVRSAHRQGAAEVTLFTDADYPASNSVYQHLGFRMVGEFAEFDIERPSTSTGS